MIITRIWENQPGNYFCISTKRGRGSWHDEFFHRDSLHKVPAYIKARRDCDVYFCPHGLSTKSRSKDEKLRPTLLWSDMDEVDPRKVTWKPTIAFESSPGRYVGIWLTDEPVTEELNRRLAYAIGADKSGWDLGQVLRVPGTINYKYSSLPHARILWSDGDSWKTSELQSRLPKLEKISTYEESDASSIYRRYERKLPAWARRACMEKKRPSEGTRSEMFFKLANTFAEAGMKRDDICTMLKANVWNKYDGRRDEEKQIARAADKAINKGVRGSRVEAPRGAEGDEYDWFGKSLAEVEEENIDWLWYPYLARGEITILEGDPGLGKSYLAQMISGHIIDGKRMPSKRKVSVKPERVLYCDLENSAGTVTKKRIKWNGFARHDNFYQEERPFSIDDIETMELLYERIGQLKPALIVFDTMNTYLGRADAFKGHEVQQTMTHFRSLAKQFGCAVLILRHLTKGSKDKLLYRGQGSTAITGMARFVITMGTMPDDRETKVFGMIKINVAPEPPPMTFTVDKLPDTLKEWDRSKFTWGEHVKGKTIEELMLARRDDDGGSSIDDAKDFVRDALDDGPVEVNKLEEMSERASIAGSVLKRALLSLGCAKRGGRWEMSKEKARSS